jgi:hypothetical protein
MSALAIASSLPTVEDALEHLKSIDLIMVKKKLMDKEEGQGWNQECVDNVEKRYLRYLCMIYMDQERSFVPTKDIDLFWHQHILDTRAYAKDCQRVFGYFIHHFPYFGMRGEEDAKDLLSGFEDTKTFYKSLFGEDYCVTDGSKDASNCHKEPGSCHKCYSGPGPMNCTTCKNK